MKFHISDKAAAWYKEELLLSDGDFVRFFARYGGYSSFQQGFSLGISNDHPDEIGVKEEKNGIVFYIENKDMWYFDSHNLYIDFNTELQEPEFLISE